MYVCMYVYIYMSLRQCVSESRSREPGNRFTSIPTSTTTPNDQQPTTTIPRVWFVKSEPTWKPTYRQPTVPTPVQQPTPTPTPISTFKWNANATVFSPERVPPQGGADPSNRVVINPTPPTSPLGTHNSNASLQHDIGNSVNAKEKTTKEKEPEVQPTNVLVKGGPNLKDALANDQHDDTLVHAVLQNSGSG